MGLRQNRKVLSRVVPKIFGLSNVWPQTEIKAVNLLLVALVAGSLVVSVSPVQSEIVRLMSIDRKEEADPLRERHPQELREIEIGKRFVINFVAKWDVDRKYKATSLDYRKKRTAESLKRAFNKEGYEKVEFLRTDFVDEKSAQSLTVKANLYWFMEGYEGIQTFYFILKRERGDWVLDWLVF
jgi:transposase